ncbi:ethanolamine phosphate transferase 3 [Seminavis robusta]|uniref:Ethanolamine phosphate transferase 3 n=1 Tax=Seminavis robusta TaxID=568900 RepID=A0A9N8E0W1_9STRA|nr:ethanolamine phosphate transferase 3 [Seminavis robusta]|eukprot:Sro538_g162630.1 ethanolamine phosphate transferase 3 (924) ;mRNA; r:39449-42313
MTSTTTTQQQHHPSRQRRPLLLDVLAPLVTLLGLYIFITSFFLAKRSLPHKSECDEASQLLESTLGLSSSETQKLRDAKLLQGCWMERRVDSMVVIVIDALRFDFALHHLPRSVGARLGNGAGNSSRLLQFVADPPTVTMQRLKALTTGGLPTFADISGNMGGASVEEDTWIQQIQTTPFAKRHLSVKPRIAFVGDDTWLDLFPHSLDEAYPYPSFNTRDLDTVDNGCLQHIPDLLAQQRTSTNNKAQEVLIVHFLGVDHVGHTYGPHDEHMDAKLQQMDAALLELLEKLDHQQDSCSVAFIFGDHGMTEDGNHGGGSEEEINAALFAHFSPACGVMTDLLLDDNASPSHDAQTAFTSIHQIDLVPTISLLLGMPIPYANLGALVPALSLFSTASQTAVALALNAAQVWRYFTEYSRTANQLPGLDELEERLLHAVTVWKEALATGEDSTATLKACSLFKLFLLEALQLGQRVWTRFDTTGMTIGIVVLFVSVILWIVPFFLQTTTNEGDPSSVWSIPMPGQLWELLLTALFVVFFCGMLTFGNSYILEEEHVCMYMIGILGFVLAARSAAATQSNNATTSYVKRYAPLVIPVASRLGELFVTGHGQDPSTRAHTAHHPMMFLSSVVLLMAGRWYLCDGLQFTRSRQHMALDLATLAFLAQAWWEKRQPESDRHGFAGARCAIALVLLSLPWSIYQALTTVHERQNQQYQEQLRNKPPTTLSLPPGDAVTIIFKLLLLVMIVTGPSSATSALLFSAQAAAVFLLSGMTGPSMIPSAVLAALWRFIIRHVFFATNHGCSFARLQLSSAFVATSVFNFAFAGLSLFINTFGWEIMGLCFAWLVSSNAMHTAKMSGFPRRTDPWRWYCLYQLIETLCSSISVSVLRRHLMVWDIYAPHFMFVALFTIFYAAFQLLVCYFGYQSNQR